MGIEFVKKPFSKQENLLCLEDYVREWFLRTFKDLTPPQRYSFKLISRGYNVLITAPTGSGKTLSAFTVILSELFKLGEIGKLKDSVYCIYVSPLRALDNDIYRNLLIPLKEIREIGKRLGKELPEVRIAIRTGDILPYEKQRQLTKPPHILITTPESLAIILNSPKFVKKLKTVKWVVIDEIHELASSKRGVHLSLSIERLREIVGKEFQRIGLGATLHPLEEAAKFLVGYDGRGRLRNCKIVDVSWFKPYDLQVLCPTKDIVHTSAERMNELMYEMLAQLISQHRTTLVFTNTRSGTERVVYHLKQKFKDRHGELIGAHHGSLSRELRWDVEERMKRGELKAIVSSTSLELGIDVGYIDLVVQLGSPKSVTRAVQRIGRSGHKLHDIAKGRIIAMDRDDLLECGVMLYCAQRRMLDRFKVPRNCLDVLAQHLVGMSLTKRWKVKEAFNLVRRSHCYRDLSFEDFLSVLRYLSGEYVSLEDRNVYGKLRFFEDTMSFGRRGKLTRVIYFLNIGTIPDEVSIDVYDVNSGKYIGDLEEEFLERLRPGDIFVLGGRTYEFRYARGLRCFVRKAEGMYPTIPAWFSELLPLSFDLALKIGEFRRRILKALRENNLERVKKIIRELPMDENSMSSLLNYMLEQYSYCGEIPNDKEVLIEETTDLHGRRFLVFHFLFGRRVNDALSRVFGIIIGKQIKSNVGLVVSDNGFALILPEGKKYSLDEAFKEIFSSDLVELLKQNIRRLELMKRRFRHVASRSYLVLRNYRGYKISVSKQQLNAQTLLRVCEEIDRNFPLIKETYREILEDVMDLENMLKVVEWLMRKRIKWKFIRTEVPSPFAHNLIVLGEADVIFMKERKERLLELYEEVQKRMRAVNPQALLSAGA
ncbi:MAG: ATP-dependent helicase [Candidatus Nanoarchaeia archaeon]|nr:ATP-dependent helicase [Candidatus Haiyanarchaeum thermophilum]MCW1303130.1 ATP-dependent helicase [Candidatus Haiyanarchaeum thermophilum]MCW1303795.1 ATP-dependent helicase [Candidatus Haiyanarchaeum thermophilum]MCW1306590.1 ATP-dependent helicase [Candidatus Haiyanarchaeum thermophilum]MCW1307002.1 ATP-dependent helicase [Candidatus Haiyanarchaeum thermophilum]